MKSFIKIRILPRHPSHNRHASGVYHPRLTVNGKSTALFVKTGIQCLEPDDPKVSASSLRLRSPSLLAATSYDYSADVAPSR